MGAYVLVHGGFCRSWIWDDTAAALSAHGHRVEAVDLPTCGPDPAASGGLQDDVDTVRRALDGTGPGTVLVGHSAYGIVLTELADHPAVRHSVYVAAMHPERGQSIADLLGQLPEWLVVDPQEGVVRVSDDPAVVRQALCADVDEDRFLREVYPRFVPSSSAVMAAPSSGPPPGHATTYVICEEDRAIPLAAQQAMSLRSDRVERLPSSHNPMLSMPERLAQVLDGAAASRSAP